ncbi:MAG: c-type cytochrome [Acidobacteriota bacterium]|nr:c-type cytochrome [Acidobacteriota bacterium]
MKRTAGRLAPALVVLTVGSAAVAEETPNPYTSRIDIRSGARLYRAKCTSCHGINATGGEEADGPDLTTGRFEHATTDTGLFRVIREGVADTAMRGLKRDTDQEIWQLVTYLRTLAGTASATDLPGDPEAGRAIYDARGCAECHAIAGIGGRLGPDLTFIGDERSPNELRTDLADPSADVDPRWWTLRITHQDGSLSEGLRMGEDTFTLRIMDADENLRSFSRQDTSSVERIKESTMPPTQLSPEEGDDLVAYLFSSRMPS